MADADDKKQQEDADDIEQQEDSKIKKDDKKVAASPILPWLLMLVVVVLCGIAGFALGRFLAGSSMSKKAEYSQEKPPQVEYLRMDGSETNPKRVWYYDLEPVVANLDEPGITRYIRVNLTFEISPKVDKEKGIAFFDEKKPVLTNCLTIYLAGLTIDDIKGDRNIRRIQSQLLDIFNEKLFPNTEPLIRQILFKEFAIQ